jgi:putative FmdB family regulatory protein
LQTIHDRQDIEVHMPIYEYECKNCQTRFEKLQSIMDDPISVCVNCGGGPVRRVLHPVGVIFKGSGWYINDSRKSTGSSGSDSGSGSGASAEKPPAPKAEESTSPAKPADTAG